MRGTRLACDIQVRDGTVVQTIRLQDQSSKKDLNMRVAVLALTSIIVLALGGSESAVANGNGSVTPPSMIAGGIKAAPEQSVKKQVTSRAKENAQASPELQRANSPDRDGPVLRLLWLLTGSSRRR
jgi:hypothetical protein